MTFRLNGHSSDSPCYTCKGRYPNCHSHCMMYAKWRSAIDDENEALRKKKDAEYEVSKVLYGKKQYIRRKLKG